MYYFLVLNIGKRLNTRSVSAIIHFLKLNRIDSSRKSSCDKTHIYVYTSFSLRMYVTDTEHPKQRSSSSMRLYLDQTASPPLHFNKILRHVRVAFTFFTSLRTIGSLSAHYAHLGCPLFSFRHGDSTKISVKYLRSKRYYECPVNFDTNFDSQSRSRSSAQLRATRELYNLRYQDNRQKLLSRGWF